MYLECERINYPASGPSRKCKKPILIQYRVLVPFAAADAHRMVVDDDGGAAKSDARRVYRVHARRTARHSQNERKS